MKLAEVEALPDSIPFERVQQLCADLLGSWDALAHVRSLTLHYNSIEAVVLASDDLGRRVIDPQTDEIAVHHIHIPVVR